MHPITQDINSGQFHKIYLLYGDEAYLRRNYKNKLLKALVAENDSMNFTRFTTDDVSAEKIIDTAETMPFFAERRVILVEDSGFFSKSNEKLADYLTESSDSCVMIFSEASVDKRSKTYKAAKEYGQLVECVMPDEGMLYRWVKGRLEKCQKQMMDKDAWTEFYYRTSSSMDMMDTELEKLISYIGERERIELSDVRTISIGQTEEKIFDMIRAISSKNTKETMAYYKGLLVNREEPFRIMYLLENQFKQLLLVKEMHNNHYSNNEISKEVGIPPYYVNKNLAISEHFSRDEVLTFLEEAASLEGQAKSGLISAQNALETLIMSHI